MTVGKGGGLENQPGFSCDLSLGANSVTSAHVSLGPSHPKGFGCSPKDHSLPQSSLKTSGKLGFGKLGFGKLIFHSVPGEPPVRCAGCSGQGQASGLEAGARGCVNSWSSQVQDQHLEMLSHTIPQDFFA